MKGSKLCSSNVSPEDSILGKKKLKKFTTKIKKPMMEMGLKDIISSTKREDIKEATNDDSKTFSKTREEIE